jgi:hypothetical protein
MDFAHVFIITLSAFLLIFVGVSFHIMFKMMRDVAAIQRAIFLFMRQKFGDIEELVKS